jgi:hypothetical protein
MLFLLRNVGALIVYLLSKKIKRALSVRPLPRQALAWLISAQRVLRTQRNASRGAPPGGFHSGNTSCPNCAENVPNEPRICRRVFYRRTTGNPGILRYLKGLYKIVMIL